MRAARVPAVARSVIGALLVLGLAGPGCGGGHAAQDAGAGSGGRGGGAAGKAGTAGGAGAGGGAGTTGAAGAGGSAGAGGGAGAIGGFDAGAGRDGGSDAGGGSAGTGGSGGGSTRDAGNAGSNGDAATCPAGHCPLVARLVAGATETCALLRDGTMKCWGYGGPGQLGYGNGANIGDDKLPSSVGPVSVSTTPGVTVTQIAAGNYHTCALLSDGTVKCWGNPYDGQLGYGNTNFIGDNELPSSVGPVSVTTIPGVTAVQIAAAANRTCALLSDSSVKCWGNNFYGQLGLGNFVNIGDNELPSSVGPISLTTTAGVTATQVAVGNDQVCALLSDHSVKCWGYGFYGELGDDSQATIGDNELPSTLGPISVTTTPGVTVAQLALGDMHVCVLLSDGSVKCWGYGAFGQLGYGNTMSVGDNELPSSVGPVSVTTIPGVTAVQIAASADSTCALLSNGSIVCWGHNESGELGYGHQDNIGDDELPSSAGPVSVTTTPGVTATQITMAGSHACALLSDGSVKCWGYGIYGQLGYGNAASIGDNELPSSVDAVQLF